MSGTTSTPVKATKSSYTTPICPRTGQRGEEGWEYRVRPTAIGPVELAEDLRYDQNKEGIVHKPSPHKSTKRAEDHSGSPAATRKKHADEVKEPKEEGEGEGAAEEKKEEKKGEKKEDDLSPEEKFHLWVKEHFGALQDAMTAQDKLGRGLISRKVFLKVLEEHSPPLPMEEIEVPSAEKTDYVAVLSSWRSAGVRIENRQRAGPAATATVPLLAAQFTSRVVSFDKLPEIRSNITAASSKLSRQREMDRARATQAVIERMNLAAVAPAPRRAIADACLLYSPSRKAAAKLLPK